MATAPDGKTTTLVMIRAAAIAIVTILSLSPAQANATELSGVASVVDGDTIELHGHRIRLHGIDAPESAQACRRSDGSAWRCGREAAIALQDRIGRRTVVCARRTADLRAPSEKKVDRYGRIVARCAVAGVDVGDWMVRNGWAVAYRRYSSAYVEAEDEARNAARGIWSGSFDMPWDWRASRRR